MIPDPCIQIVEKYSIFSHKSDAHSLLFFVLLLFCSIIKTKKSPEDSPFVQIMRASHVIKGAASNLMCGELRQCAMKLETAASSAANESNGKNDTELLEGVKGVYEDLKVAVENYQKYLKKIGV